MCRSLVHEGVSGRRYSDRQSDSRCVGCKVCTIACPFGTVNYSSATGKVIKCDLCGGDPACASACPTEAITYVDSDWTGLDRMRAYASQSLSGAAQG